jgi:hypothetical protein
MVSGRMIVGKVIKIETNAYGNFIVVEFGEEVAFVTASQIVGHYEFCFNKMQPGKGYVPSYS